MSDQRSWPSNGYGAYQGYNQALPEQMYAQRRSENQYPPQQQQQQNHGMLPQPPRQNFQQSPQLHSTSPLPYQPTQPQYYQPTVNQYGQTFHLPYQTPSVQQPLAQVSHQPQYFQAQTERSQPIQGYYQPNYGQVQPPSSYIPNSRSHETYFRPQQTSTPQQASHPHASPGIAAHEPQNQTSRTPQARPVQQATPQQRTVSHVRIPVYRPDPTPIESPMHRATKRRRSNDGNVVPVCAAPVPQKPHAQQRVRNEPVVSSSPLTELASSQLPPTPKPNADYQAILLHLSDEYITEAYRMSSQLVSTGQNGEQLERYQSLMAMAMGCLESVLITYRRLDPRKEARIRLRLASLLHEETENIDAAEEVLSKGISLCERSRLTDLKYAMQHLLARITFNRSPKAAFKSLEKLIADTEALNLVQWNYAFRFLHITLTLSMGGSDTAVLLKHLAAISSSAEYRRHVAVRIVTAALETMVYLRSGSTDAVDLAQRALAAARTHQLGPDMQKMPQIRVLLEFLDFACGMLHFNADQVAAKLVQLHDTLDKTSKLAGWTQDGTVTLPLGFAGNNDEIEADTACIFQRTADAGVALRLQWLSSSQAYELGYVLSGSAMMYKNAENSKAEKYLREGIKMIEKGSHDFEHSLSAAAVRTGRKSSLTVHARLQLAFACCVSSDWGAVEAVLREVRQDSTETDKVCLTTAAFLAYLTAMCKHAAGDLDAALSLYSSPVLVFRPSDKQISALRDTQVLACLSSIVILRVSSRKERQGEAGDLMSATEVYCLTHREQAFVAAWHMLKATSEPNMPIIKTKQFLQSAIKAGRTSFNQRLMCIIMNIMTQMYFANIVGDQAEKSARAGRSLALKTKDKLWLAVADGMSANTAELSGKNDHAKTARDEAKQAVAGLPEKIKQQLAGVDVL